MVSRQDKGKKKMTRTWEDAQKQTRRATKSKPPGALVIREEGEQQPDPFTLLENLVPVSPSKRFGGSDDEPDPRAPLFGVFPTIPHFPVNEKEFLHHVINMPGLDVSFYGDLLREHTLMCGFRQPDPHEVTLKDVLHAPPPPPEPEQIPPAPPSSPVNSYHCRRVDFTRFFAETFSSGSSNLESRSEYIFGDGSEPGFCPSAPSYDSDTSTAFSTNRK